MEYKFRGWDITGQKGWIYGDLTHCKKVLKEDPYLEDRVMVGGYEVVPESVGIFTTVSNIFEGDIVESSDSDGEYMCGVVEWYKPHGGFLVKCRKESVGLVGHYFFSAKWKVIGNIFENRDLLYEQGLSS